MSILGINQIRWKKTVIVYGVFVAFCMMVAYVYNLFGHGVHSNSMDYMFVYPLIGGSIFYGILGILTNHKVVRFSYYRIGYNLYNAGLATLTVRSFYQGVLEIAGASSTYLTTFMMIGGLLMVIGCLTMIIALLFKEE